MKVKMGGFMENTSKDFQAFHIAIAGAICTIAGTFFSGPLAFIAVSSIQPQPEWSGAQVYVAHYHPVQSLTFYFGLILLFGSVLMITSIYFLNRKSIKSLLALIFTAIACGLISFNYFIQAALIPALIRNYTPALDPVVTLFAVANPSSLFWAIEMWGYGFLGLGTLFAGGFFSGRGLEKATRILFLTNGYASLAGALYTSIRLEWVLSKAGLATYVGWNILYLFLVFFFLIVILRRRVKLLRLST